MTRGLHWFRNDLRLTDHASLDALFGHVDQWLPVFVLDPRIANRASAVRTRFLIANLERLEAELASRDVPLVVRKGKPEQVIPKLLDETKASHLSFAPGNTPFARDRDDAVRRAAEKREVSVLDPRDDVIFPADAVLTKSGTPYAVYSPYRDAWWRRFREESPEPRRMRATPPPIPNVEAGSLPDAESVVGKAGAEVELPTAGHRAARRRLRTFLEGPVARYHEDRDRPDKDGTSRLSPYLRFGVISIRSCFDAGLEAAAEASHRRGVTKWLDELVWREFYAAILESQPRVLKQNYREEYDALAWNDDPDAFEAWCEGRTGFPIVDAGMRQLRATGWMHNRVRMLVASFLTKDLLIDWRAGERFFFEWLVDGDPASNNGGWQWAASTGTDAQPYFRIFNPTTQARRYDPDGAYVKEWVPELRDVPAESVHEPWDGLFGPEGYPRPIVDHAKRREEALARFKAARQETS